jgi:uncharacterized membrane protein YtjA (UPF0391 family)
MFGRWTIITIILCAAAAVLGFGLVPGVPDSVQIVAVVLFFVFLFFFVISLFDVVGEAFRRE